MLLEGVFIDVVSKDEVAPGVVLERVNLLLFFCDFLGFAICIVASLVCLKFVEDLLLLLRLLRILFKILVAGLFELLDFLLLLFLFLQQFHFLQLDFVVVEIFGCIAVSCGHLWLLGSLLAHLACESRLRILLWSCLFELAVIVIPLVLLRSLASFLDEELRHALGAFLVAGLQLRVRCQAVIAVFSFIAAS